MNLCLIFQIHLVRSFFDSNPTPPTSPSKRAQIQIPIGLTVPHTVTSVTPTSGPSGAQVTVNGTNFIVPPVGVTVKFGTWDMTPIIGSNANGNVVTKYYVAKNLQPGVYPVTVTINGLTVGGPSYTVTNPSNFTATRSLLYGQGGGSITSVQYKKNSGAWTTFSSPITFLATDSMSYRATFQKAGGIGAAKVYGSIDSIATNIDGNGTNSVTLTLPAFTSAQNQTIVFNVQSI
ncbi:MAG: hypothetical protein HC836_39345 [Richelia sp. RM2_1_2]|nr:hypothetical protein [Richelia sp. RM2_1_2]